MSLHVRDLCAIWKHDFTHFNTQGEFVLSWEKDSVFSIEKKWLYILGIIWHFWEKENQWCYGLVNDDILHVDCLVLCFTLFGVSILWSFVFISCLYWHGALIIFASSWNIKKREKKIYCGTSELPNTFLGWKLKITYLEWVQNIISVACRLSLLFYAKITLLQKAVP